MAESTTYTPTDSVEENLKQLQSRDMAEKAKMKNAAKKVMNVGRKVEHGLLNLNGVAKGAAVAAVSADGDLFSDVVSQEESKAMSGTMELPSGIDNQLDAYAKAAAEGKHPKILSWEHVSDKLSVPALNKAWDVGLIDEDNERHRIVGDIQARYDGAEQVVAPVKDKVFVPGAAKVLPEMYTNSDKDFLHTSFDMAEAMANASDYLVGDESQLQGMFEASNMGMSREEFDESSTGLVHDASEDVDKHSRFVSMAEEFASQVRQNGFDTEYNDAYELNS